MSIAHAVPKALVSLGCGLCGQVSFPGVARRVCLSKWSLGDVFRRAVAITHTKDEAGLGTKPPDRQVASIAEPQLAAMGKMNLIGMVSSKAGNAAELWRHFLRRIPAISERVEPDFVYELHYRSVRDIFFMPSVSVGSLTDVPLDMLGKTLPATEYAVFIHTGPASRLPETYLFVYNTWLPRSGYRIAYEYDFEQHRRAEYPGGDSDIRVFVPIVNASRGL